jgi:hypothetical protein
MANPVPLPPPGFDDLTVDEQISHVQSLWDRIPPHQGPSRSPTGTSMWSAIASTTWTPIPMGATAGRRLAVACATASTSHADRT